MADHSSAQDFVEIREGKAKILFPRGNQVFYNPVQQLNRDLSIAVIKYYTQHYWQPLGAHKKKGSATKPSTSVNPPPAALPVAEEQRDEEGTSPLEAEGSGASKQDECIETSKLTDVEPSTCTNVKGPRVLEALAASGLRSIRYALEIPTLGSVVANDFSEVAYENMCRNIKENGVSHLISPTCREASMLMYENRDPPNRQFDVIDIDPYGSPSRFLDGTVQACANGGLLCITCTDMAVLCGNHCETAFNKYGSISLKTKYCHEMALRIVLASLESHANRYQRYIVPLLSCSVDFYMRVFVMLQTGATGAKKSASKQSMVYHCSGCGSFYLQSLGRITTTSKGGQKYCTASGPPVDRKCDQCGSGFKVGGPIWSEPIHDIEFVRGLRKAVVDSQDCYHTSDRMLGLLSVISEELPDVPLFYSLDELCSTLHCNSVKMLAIRSALLKQGYRVSISHADPKAIKTDAPHHVVWDIMRCWVKRYPVKNISPNSPAAALLSKEPQFDASFEIRTDANPPSRLLKLTRFPENPEPNWGPKSRAKRRHDGGDDQSSKRPHDDQSQDN